MSTYNRRYQSEDISSIFNFKQNFNSFLRDLSTTQFSSLLINSTLQSNPGGQGANSPWENRPSLGDIIISKSEGDSYSTVSFNTGAYIYQSFKLRPNTEYTAVFIGCTEFSNSLSFKAVPVDPDTIVNITPFSYAVSAMVEQGTSDTITPSVIQFKTSSNINPDTDNVKIYISNIKGTSITSYITKIILYRGLVQVADVPSLGDILGSLDMQNIDVTKYYSFVKFNERGMATDGNYTLIPYQKWSYDCIALGTSTLNENSNGSRNIALGNYALQSNTTGNDNVAIGHNSLNGNDNGYQNIAIGSYALQHADAGGGDTNQNNISIGYNSLYNETKGLYNVCIGTETLYNGNDNTSNISIGNKASYNDAHGDYNIAIGHESMYCTTGATGVQNIGIGSNTLHSLSTGNYNIALGNSTLYQCNSGASNVGIGNSNLRYCTAGYNNVGIGHVVLYYNITGYNNVGIGSGALFYSFGNNNIGIGQWAVAAYGASTGNNNIGIGNYTLYNVLSGSNNLCLGNYAGKYVTTQDNIVIIDNFDRSNYNGQVSGAPFYAVTNVNPSLQMVNLNANTNVLGNLGVSGNENVNGNVNIGGSVGVSGSAKINNNLDIGGSVGVSGSLGVSGNIATSGSLNVKGGLTVDGDLTLTNGLPSIDGDMIINGDIYANAFYATSSKRYKYDIKTLQNSLDTIDKLRGVSFKMNADNKSQIGLIAEEVFDIIPEVVNLNDNNQPDSISYANMVGILVEAIKELKIQVINLKSEIAEIKGS